MTDDAKKRMGATAPPVFRIEADGFHFGMQLLVTGVVGICELSDSHIVLMMKREKLKIVGKCLEVSIYERNTVEIKGGIVGFERVGFALKYGGKNDKT